MLSDEDKQRIREEEIFRAEVQTSLSQATTPQPFPHRFWAFLNTSLGIWVLSTIVLGGVGGLYTQWRLSREDIERINNLDIEIDGRFEETINAITAQEFKKKDDSPIFVANTLLLPPMGEHMIQPEYANRNMMSLMYELLSRLPVEEQGDIENALVELRQIKSTYLNKELAHEDAMDVMRRTYNLQNSRWKWDKMMTRHMAIYNYPYNLMMRLSAFVSFFGLLFLVSWMFYVARQNRLKTPVPISVQEIQSQGKEDSDQDKAVKVQTGNP